MTGAEPITWRGFKLVDNSDELGSPGYVYDPPPELINSAPYIGTAQGEKPGEWGAVIEHGQITADGDGPNALAALDAADDDYLEQVANTLKDYLAKVPRR